ncbi:uncharacterized protein FIBRA_07974 [Fibroporia radiculosa]|uniref:Nephrocystin 3-like N-terminal domain-containing protein n=1 Tax=Fibroporia radiculosa TaxID=599839 RepID=J4I1U0_9APHY|nr:uncharacterized protein FIBRA_07974 [Fibroporia radiculosa]CCM05742.1 predicted protein [Fibroporia radiculosa]
MGPGLSGVVTITNTHYGNRVKMRNNNDAEPLICVVPNLPEVPKAELWRLIPSTNNRYQIKNLEFGYTASTSPVAKVDTHVDGSDREYWWVVEKAEEKFGPDAYFIQHRKLCWHLIDESNETPIELQTLSMDRRSVWKIERYMDPDARNHTSDGERLPETTTADISAFPTSSLKALVDFNSAIDAGIDATKTMPAFSIVKCASEMLLNHGHRYKELFDLLKFIANIYGELVTEKELLSNFPTEATLVVEKLARQLLECADFITHYSEKIVFCKDIDRETRMTMERYQENFDGFMQQIHSRTFNEISSPIYRGALDVDFSGLEFATGTGLNYDKQCLLGTRKEIISEVQGWILTAADNAKKVFWLYGIAGRGKSAIAHTIARWANERGSLGSCFCFDRTRREDHYIKILNTIAKDLAHYNPLVRRELARTLHEENELRHTRDLTQQWTKLIIDPLRAASKATRTPVLIVIDALDESGAEDTRRLLLQLISGKQTGSPDPATELPHNIRILITSRPLPDILSALHDQQRVHHVSLDDVASESTGRDVEQYVAAKLRDLDDFDIKDYAALAHKSDGVFEWARLSCEYIARRSFIGPNHRSRYDAVITGESATRHLLDHMYVLILTEAMPREERMNALRVFRSVMGQVLALLEPLSRASLRRFSVKDGGDVDFLICSLGALLTGVTDDQIPIKPLHASFYDFLMDKSRSGEFFIEVSAVHHQNMAFASLRVMKDELRFNICHLENSYLPNSAVTYLEERVKRCISPELQYSCHFWTFHVKVAKHDPSLAREIEYFLTTERVLFYLEVLSLTHSLGGTARALSSIIPWFKDHEIARARQTIADIQQFVETFTATILQSTPHLYLSALPSAPTSSVMFQKFSARFPGGIKNVAGSMTIWPSMQELIYEHMRYVACVTISHDGRRIVSGSYDCTIRVWDTDTGKQLGKPLEGHTDSVTSVAISHDGRRVVSDSDDGTIRTWNTTSGVTTSLDTQIRPFGAPTFARTDSFTSNTTQSVSTNVEAVGVQTSVTSRMLNDVRKMVGWRQKQKLSEQMACTCDPYNSDQSTNINVDALHDRPICYSSNPAHALKIPTTFWGNSAPSSLLPDEEGWVVGPEGQLLFWVPIELMDPSRMYAPGNALVIPNDGLQLDLSRFTHGEAWHQCYNPDRE